MRRGEFLARRQQNLARVSTHDRVLVPVRVVRNMRQRVQRTGILRQANVTIGECVSRYSTVLCFIKVIVVATVGERSTRRFRLERPEEGATYAAVEKEASLDERGAPPA